MQTVHETWKTLGIKDKIQYTVAVILILSGIAIAYISFFLTFGIEAGVLTYISEAFITGGGIFGVSIYFKGKLTELRGETLQSIENAVERAIKAKSD